MRREIGRVNIPDRTMDRLYYREMLEHLPLRILVSLAALLSCMTMIRSILRS